ncbi:hypothetical protein K0M31_019106 [Melipona bicolor]|uniref:Uncharacterized protein n=1 Tax=Melipona bicolor TaxID=60889 RepID=A0AA40KR11_9HYME|nr:hypothetical protein K0M31_019106 [Melipona bicolor]
MVVGLVELVGSIDGKQTTDNLASLRSYTSLAQRRVKNPKSVPQIFIPHYPTAEINTVGESFRLKQLNIITGRRVKTATTRRARIAGADGEKEVEQEYSVQSPRPETLKSESSVSREGFRRLWIRILNPPRERSPIPSSSETSTRRRRASFLGSVLSILQPCSIENSRLVGIHRTDIRYNRASLSKIKQREPPGRRILAAALFVRTCKQWNYPFPVRIYPDDSQPVADLPPGKHNTPSLTKVHKEEKLHAPQSLKFAAETSRDSVERRKFEPAAADGVVFELSSKNTNDPANPTEKSAVTRY